MILVRVDVLVHCGVPSVTDGLWGLGPAICIVLIRLCALEVVNCFLPSVLMKINLFVVVVVERQQGW